MPLINFPLTFPEKSGMIQKNKKGSEIMAQYVTITSDKRKTPALLLCILGFFGIAGLHRFYVEKLAQDCSGCAPAAFS